MNILLDADALVAIAKIDDKNHQKALKTATRLQNDTLFISAFSIPEAATVISHKVSQEAAVKFLEEARKRKITEIELTRELAESADEIFSRQTQKRTFWPDCLNIAIAEKYAIDAIFSFDKTYGKNKIKMV